MLRLGTQIINIPPPIVAPISGTTDEVERIDNKVAELCRIYALATIRMQEPQRNEIGLYAFQGTLAHHFEREYMLVCAEDSTNVTKLYISYFNRYAEAVTHYSSSLDRVHLVRVIQIMGVLYNVLEFIKSNNPFTPDREIIKIRRILAEWSKRYVPHNILSLGPDGADSAFSFYPEIIVIMSVLKNTRALIWQNHVMGQHDDILDWLQISFGFQRDNVANQRENLVMLIWNARMRISQNEEHVEMERALGTVMDNLFENYENWCSFLGRRSNLRLPTLYGEVQQRKLLYTALYLLIWGEASNLRLMPECLCYMFHHMAYEVYTIVDSAIRDDKTKNRYLRLTSGVNEGDFLRGFIKPFYEIIENVQRSDKSKCSHCKNYDDFNEYFWSNDCFRLGWRPLKTHSSFDSDHKINFVETRTFWNIFRSFNRMWVFLIICFQAMITIGLEEETNIFRGKLLKKLLSIFIATTLLNLVHVVLDVILTWGARGSMSVSDKLKQKLKVVFVVSWVIILPVTYTYMSNPLEVSWRMISHTPYIWALIGYLAPDMFVGVTFFLPCVRRLIERSNSRICRFITWWYSQPRLYVRRGLHESLYCLFKYTLFWFLFIVIEMIFSYYQEIRPYIGPTKEIMHSNIHQRHALFPRVKYIFDVIVWAPIVLVYSIDITIWYSILSILVGGMCGIFHHLWEIHTIGMLRSRFHSLPGAFNSRLIAKGKNRMSKNKGMKARFCCKFDEIPCNKMETAKFALLWNRIIISFREEDLISNRSNLCARNN